MPRCTSSWDASANEPRGSRQDVYTTGHCCHGCRARGSHLPHRERASSASASPARRLIVEAMVGLVSGTGAGRAGLLAAGASTDGTSVSLRSRPAAREGGSCGGLRGGWSLRGTPGPGKTRSEPCGALTRPGSRACDTQAPQGGLQRSTITRTWAREAARSPADGLIPCASFPVRRYIDQHRAAGSTTWPCSHRTNLGVLCPRRVLSFGEATPNGTRS